MLVAAHAPACTLARDGAALRLRRVACAAAAQLRAQRPEAGVALPHARRLAARPLRAALRVTPRAAASHRAVYAVSRRAVCATGPQLDLTEENVEQVLRDARLELSQMFDEDVGMTGTCTLADLDGPFVTLRLKGRFWHPRGMVLARVAQYMQSRIPEVAEVRIENEKQLDDSAENF